MTEDNDKYPHKKDIASYRPIKLLPVMGKLFEKIIKGRIGKSMRQVLASSSNTNFEHTK